MNLTEAFILGLLQGLTEFLPVSSSGHLVLGQKLLGFSQPPILFDVLVHAGSLAAVFLFFNKLLLQLLKASFQAIISGRFKNIPSLIWLVVIGTIPAFFAGLFLNDYVEQIFNSVILVGFSLILTALILFLAARIKGYKKIKDIFWMDALIIGGFQALAILPGISRSGSTVSAGLWRKLDRETAFNFSFLLSIPAILGALTLQVKNVNNFQALFTIPNFTGFLTAGIAGYVSLIIFKNSIIKGKLAYFGTYCLILGTGVLLFSVY